MAGGRVLTGTGPAPNVSNISILLQNQTTGRGNSEQPLDSLFLPTTPAPFFAGSRSMMSFKDVQGGNKGCSSNSRSFFRAFDLDESCDDGMDEYFHQPEKKRRLSVEQVQFLEKSFEVENKLEPDRKTKIAKDLGLQPRQVAIWFQNRRARWKTKQLEKDYDSLHASFESLKTNYDDLLKEKDRLKAEVESLTEKVLAREKQGGKLFNIQQGELSETNGLQEQEPLPQKPLLDNTSVSEGEGSKVSAGGCNKQEDISSGCRSDDIMDSDSSPRYRDGGVHSASALLETGDNSSYVFEPDQSDLSQDEEDNLSRTLLHPYLFPKLGDDHDVNYSDPPESSSSFGFPEEDDHALWPWSY